MLVFLPFTGTLCELEINECDPEPCTNGGICTDLLNGFTCQCPFPYSGTTCQQLPCDSFPCLNQGKCTNIFTSPGYQCQCTSGYVGKSLCLLVNVVFMLSSICTSGVPDRNRQIARSKSKEQIRVFMILY